MKDKNVAKKEKAIELLKEMDIYTPCIKGFQEKGMVCYFENYGGFWIDQEPELYAKLKELEKKHNCLVYAVTHEYTEFSWLTMYEGNIKIKAPENVRQEYITFLHNLIEKA